MSCSYCVGTHLGHCPCGSAHQWPISGTWSPIEQQSSIPGISSRLSGIRSEETPSSRDSLFWSLFPGEEVLVVSRQECHCLQRVFSAEPKQTLFDLMIEPTSEVPQYHEDQRQV